MSTETRFGDPFYDSVRVFVGDAFRMVQNELAGASRNYVPSNNPVTRSKAMRAMGKEAVWLALAAAGCTGPLVEGGEYVPNAMIPLEERRQVVYELFRDREARIAVSGAGDFIALAQNVLPIYEQFQKDENRYQNDLQNPGTAVEVRKEEGDNFLALIRSYDLMIRIMDSTNHPEASQRISDELLGIICSALAQRFTETAPDKVVAGEYSEQDILDYSEITKRFTDGSYQQRTDEEIVDMARELAVAKEKESLENFIKTFNLREEIVLWVYTNVVWDKYQAEFPGMLNEYVQGDDMPEYDDQGNYIPGARLHNAVINFFQRSIREEEFERGEGSFGYYVKNIYTYEQFKVDNGGIDKVVADFYHSGTKIHKAIWQIMENFMVMVGKKFQATSFANDLATNPFIRQELDRLGWGADIVNQLAAEASNIDAAAERTAKCTLAASYLFSRPDKVVVEITGGERLELGRDTDAAITSQLRAIQQEGKTIERIRLLFDNYGSWHGLTESDIRVEELFFEETSGWKKAEIIIEPKENQQIDKLTYYAQKTDKGIIVQPGLQVTDRGDNNRYFISRGWDPFAWEGILLPHIKETIDSTGLASSYFAEVNLPDGIYSAADLRPISKDLADLLTGGYVAYRNTISRLPEAWLERTVFGSLEGQATFINSSKGVMAMPSPRFLSSQNPEAEKIPGVPVMLLKNPSLGSGASWYSREITADGWLMVGETELKLPAHTLVPLLSEFYSIADLIKVKVGDTDTYYVPIGVRVVGEGDPETGIKARILQKLGGDPKYDQQTVVLAVPADQAVILRNESLLKQYWRNGLLPDLIYITLSLAAPMTLKGLPEGLRFVAELAVKYGHPDGVAWALLAAYENSINYQKISLR